MDYCQVPKYLAYFMAVYCIACGYYMFQTRNVGTPFKDSLTKKQLKIKKESAKLRSNIFFQGLAVGFAIMLVMKPFKDCFEKPTELLEPQRVINLDGQILKPNQVLNTIDLPLRSVLSLL